MSPARKRLLRVAAVVSAQLVLCWAAVALLGARTTYESSERFGDWRGSFSEYLHVHGSPVAWIEHLEWVTHYRSAGAEERLKRTKYRGRNLVVPVVLLAFAITAPPVIAVFGYRVVNRPREPAPRIARVAGVILFASMPTLFVAWLEGETDSFKVGWRARWNYPQPGSGITDTALSHVRDGRDWLRTKVVAADMLLGSDWPARTRLTLLAFATGAGVGCALLRPWRRPARCPEAPAVNCRRPLIAGLLLATAATAPLALLPRGPRVTWAGVERVIAAESNTEGIRIREYG